MHMRNMWITCLEGLLAIKTFYSCVEWLCIAMQDWGLLAAQCGSSAWSAVQAPIAMLLQWCSAWFGTACYKAVPSNEMLRGTLLG